MLKLLRYACILLFVASLPWGRTCPGDDALQPADRYAECALLVQQLGDEQFSVRERAGKTSAYVWDVVIEPEHQRKGHASRAFRELEEKVLAMGLDGIGLNVFGDNVSAQRLYARLGYEPVNIFMYKHLEKGTI